MARIVKTVMRNSYLVERLSIQFNAELIDFRRERFRTSGRAATHYGLKRWLWHQYESGRRPLPKWLEEELQKHREGKT